MYAKYFKRFFDLIISFCALVVLSPVLIILVLVGSIEMKGNPFFTQERPGLHEKIFLANKFLTTTKWLLNGYFSEGQKALKAA